MEPIPLEDLKAEKCPRISAEDLIELSEMSGPALSRSPTKKRESSKPKILIIDSRTQDEYPLPFSCVSVFYAFFIWYWKSICRFNI